MEIYGREGTLVAAGEDSPQLGSVTLHAATRDNTLVPMPVPERFTIAAAATPAGEPSNVGQMYTLFAKAIRDGNSRQPTFETAVELHRLIDAVRQASDDGREVTLG
jgi:predicted dehydrogenase